MWHKPCRTFHPWCLCIKTRCLFSFDNMIFDTALATAFKSNQLWYRALRYIRYQNDGVIHRQYGNRCPTKIKPSTCEPGHYFRMKWQHLRFSASHSHGLDHRVVICLCKCRITVYNIMMTSSNGNIFRVTGPLCGESTGHRWIHLTKASDAELWYFRWYAPE